MSFKLHCFNSHLDYFPENLGAVSEEQGERFHQDIKDMERRYQGRWDTNMMGNYCWMLHRENITSHKRKSPKRSFETKKLDFINIYNCINVNRIFYDLKLIKFV